MARPRIRFTREDYEQLPEHVHAELVEGDLVMVPAPTPWHEHLVTKLLFALHDHLGAEASRRVLGSRTEVSIGKGAEESILQPDAMVLPEGTRPTGPDWKVPTPVWVAEVLSPSTAKRDRGVKVRIYAAKGIREAWLVDPEAETIEVHDLAGGGRRAFASGGRAQSVALPGLAVDVGGFFTA